ncbi:hypothetical protein Tco_0071598 [Tanacetum coccineum]
MEATRRISKRKGRVVGGARSRGKGNESSGRQDVAPDEATLSPVSRVSLCFFSEYVRRSCLSFAQGPFLHDPSTFTFARSTRRLALAYVFSHGRLVMRQFQLRPTPQTVRQARLLCLFRDSRFIVLYLSCVVRTVEGRDHLVSSATVRKSDERLIAQVGPVKIRDIRSRSGESLRCRGVIVNGRCIVVAQASDLAVLLLRELSVTGGRNVRRGLWVLRGRCTAWDGGARVSRRSDPTSWGIISAILQFSRWGVFSCARALVVELRLGSRSFGAALPSYRRELGVSGVFRLAVALAREGRTQLSSYQRWGAGTKAVVVRPPGGSLTTLFIWARFLRVEACIGVSVCVALGSSRFVADCDIAVGTALGRGARVRELGFWISASVVGWDGDGSSDWGAQFSRGCSLGLDGDYLVGVREEGANHSLRGVGLDLAGIRQRCWGSMLKWGVDCSSRSGCVGGGDVGVESGVARLWGSNRDEGRVVTHLPGGGGRRRGVGGGG